jgi:hypothetical protein
MGARGPLPKPRRQRARDERRRLSTRVVLEGKGRKAPTLPASVKLPPAVRAWWRALWSSPISRQYDDVDVPALVRVAILWAKAVQGEASAAELGELRQLETAFGLTPAARIRLNWCFPDEAGGEPELADVPRLADVRRVRARDSADPREALSGRERPRAT